MLSPATHARSSHDGGESPAVGYDQKTKHQAITRLLLLLVCRAAGAAGTGGRRLLQAEDASLFIKTDSNQSVPITDANYQGGKAIIHIIDGVLIPASLAGNYSLADIPGASNATSEETAAEPDTVGANETEPATAANDTSAAGGAGAPAPAPAPAPKSSAGTAVAALLAAPALLAVLML